MGGTELLAFIGEGASVVVGTVSENGEPRATRAWSAHPVDPAAGRIRVVMGADDAEAVANLANVSVSVNGADVRTLHSVQVKGDVVAVEPLTEADVARVTTHTDAFFGAVSATDGIAISSLRRLLPHAMVAFELVVTGVFDQSPGPDAGAVVGASR